MTEYGDGFALTTIDPNDPDGTRDIVIQSIAVWSGFDILVVVEVAIISGRFAIEWIEKFTYESEASE